MFPPLAVYLLPLLVLVGASGRGAFWFLVPGLVLLVAPALDALLPERPATVGDGKRPRRSWLWLLPLRLWPLVQLAVFAVALTAVFEAPLAWCFSARQWSGSESSPAWLRAFESPPEFQDSLGLVLALGLTAGVGGINIAHELLHRREALDRSLAELLMVLVGYPQFCVEHVHGHHRHVATPLDPASARRGESLYRFLVRSVVGSSLKFWVRETERTRRLGIPPWSLRNRRLRYPLWVGLSWLAVAACWGPWAWLLWVIHGGLAVAMLEIINYVEHYGLERKQSRTGSYERVRPHHSWNSRARFSNWMLFNLPLHSDHHHLASRPYWELESRAAVPEFPAGYGSMLLLSLLPPLWRLVMHPRLDAYASFSRDENE